MLYVIRNTLYVFFLCSLIPTYYVKRNTYNLFSVAQEIRLIRQSNFDIAILHHTLTTQARIDTRINCAIDEILFLIWYFLDVIHSFVHINMTGAASANAAAVVLQFDTVLEANIQYWLTFGNRQFNWFVPFLLKADLNFIDIHYRAKVTKFKYALSPIIHFDNTLT